MRNYFIGIAFCFLVLNSNMFSQIVLEGTVRTHGMDPESVPNALVVLIDQVDTTRVFSSTTDDLGHYSIQITETGIGDVPAQKPGAFNLFQNYPNPFNPATVITWELPHPADVRIEIYNVLGQKIKILFDGFQSSYFGRIIWNGTNDRGQGVSAGVYIYSLSAEGTRINKKMLLIDGHTGVSNFAQSNTMEGNSSNINVLNKPLSNNFLLRVSGNDVCTYEQKNLQIFENMVHDVSVYYSMTDIDGIVYPIVKIGGQWWMAENLKVTKYRNGDDIPNVTSGSEWDSLTTGAYCYYNNDSNKAANYGALYNWNAVNDSRNIAPAGWHVSTDEEWKQLEMYVGMNRFEADDTLFRGINEGGKLKETGTDHWKSPNTGATNESGFTARPGGCRQAGINGFFNFLSYYSYFGTATEDNFNNVWYRILSFDNANVFRLNYNKRCGYSIRCVRDVDTTLTLNKIEINPLTVTLEIGKTRRFTCIATYSDSSICDVTDFTTWSVSPGIAGSIDSGGLFTAHESQTGVETITAAYLGISSNATATVITVDPGTLTDIDGNVYKTVKIGNQWWMTENLRVTHYRNGDAIPNVTGNSEWGSLKTGAYCYYDNSSSTAAVYGALYNWYAADDSRNIAPVGWHVPRDDEWQTLLDYLGGEEIAGGKLKETGTAHWNSPNEGATNESGFTARPGGYRDFSYGKFSDLGETANFCSATEVSSHSAFGYRLNYFNVLVDSHFEEKQVGLSIRLVRD